MSVHMPPQEESPQWSSALRMRYGQNLTRERLQCGLGIDDLAKRSGLHAVQLRQMEVADLAYTPSVQDLWSVCNALHKPFSSLFSDPTGRAQSTTLADGGYRLSLLHRQSGIKNIESFLVQLTPNTAHVARAHGRGVTEHIVVTAGELLVGSVQRPRLLAAGESYRFDADVEHLYRSLDEPASAMVTIVYPGWRGGTHQQELHHVWPGTEVQWEEVRRQLISLRREASHGVGAFKIQFDAPQISLRLAADRLDEAKVALDDCRLGACLYVVVDQAPAFVVLNQIHCHANLQSESTGNSVLDQAIDLINEAAAPCRPRNVAQLQAWMERVRGPGMLLPALAANALTRNGLPCAPPVEPAIDHTRLQINADRSECIVDDYFDLPAYCTYIPLHPAYARRCVAIAIGIQRWLACPPERVIDIGAGPGRHLQMLFELISLPHVLAVEPNRAALSQLARNFHEDKRVEVLCADVGELEPDDHPAYRLALCMEASHYQDTLVMLRSVHALLAEGGYFMVCGQMISTFNTVEQRNNSLIQHHLQHILDTMVPVPDAGMTHEEANVLQRTASEVPLAMYEARVGQTQAAMDRCRRLLDAYALAGLPTRPSHPLLAYQRLHRLELEALVAGLDYVVETKTSAATLVDLARHAGFTLQEHLRLYATSGLSEWDAGTHFFVFQSRQISR